MSVRTEEAILALVEEMRDLRAAVEAIAKPTPALLDAEQAGAMLNVPSSWILAEARAGRIPHVKLGRYVRLDADDLRAWTAGRSVGPRPRLREVA